MPQSIEHLGRRGWRFGAHIYRTEAAAKEAAAAADPYGRRPLSESEQTLDCAKCGALKGERCRNKYGMTASVPHQPRMRDHVRQCMEVPPDWRKLPPLDRRQRLRKRAVIAAILEHRSIADAIVRARTTGRA